MGFFRHSSVQGHVMPCARPGNSYVKWLEYTGYLSILMSPPAGGLELCARLGNNAGVPQKQLNQDASCGRPDWVTNPSGQVVKLTEGRDGHQWRFFMRTTMEGLREWKPAR